MTKIIYEGTTRYTDQIIINAVIEAHLTFGYAGCSNVARIIGGPNNQIKGIIHARLTGMVEQGKLERYGDCYCVPEQYQAMRQWLIMKGYLK